jgi:hypothetical protein
MTPDDEMPLGRGLLRWLQEGPVTVTLQREWSDDCSICPCWQTSHGYVIFKKAVSVES